MENQEVTKMNRYCVLCNREFGPHLLSCCTNTSLVAVHKEAFFKKRIRFYSLSGAELTEADLARLRESERSKLRTIPGKKATPQQSEVAVAERASEQRQTSIPKSRTPEPPQGLGVTPPPVATTTAPRTTRPDERYCGDCGELVAIGADRCPHCGVQQRGGVSKTALLLITFFLGGIGGHKFYLKRYWLGVLYLVFCWTWIPQFIALIEFIVYACTSSEKLRRKYTATSSAVVVVIVCLAGVVFVGGILSAITIPQYLNYIARAKANVAKANYDTAIALVKSEFAKESAALVATSNVVAELNGGIKRSPYDQTLPAFVEGSTLEKGQVALSVTNLHSVAMRDAVRIQVDWTGDSTADEVTVITRE